MLPTCETCRSYQPPAAPGTGPGECRRRSPKAWQDARTGAFKSIWPKVWGEVEWCGEHRPDNETGECVEKDKENGE
jgi:hypothetical protein